MRLRLSYTPDDLSGSFELRRFGGSTPRLPFPPEKAPPGKLSLRPASGKPWLQAQEFFSDPVLAHEAPQARYAYEGITTRSSSLIYALLRDNLTRRPKTYHLARRKLPDDDEDALVLEGGSFETESMQFDPEHGLTAHWRVQLIRAGRISEHAPSAQ